MTLGRKINHNFLTQNSHVYVDNLFCSPVTPLEVRTLTGNFQKLLAQVKTTSSSSSAAAASSSSSQVQTLF